MPDSSRKRIAIFLPSLGGGGAERVALTLIKHFLSQAHAVDLVLAKAEGELLPLVPAKVRLIDLKAPRLRHALAGLRRYLRRERPDALQVSMWPLTVIGILAHRWARSDARLVVSEHTTLTRHYERRATRALIRLTTALLYPLAADRVAVSQGVAEDLARLSGMDAGRFRVIPNPVDRPSSLRPSPSVEALWEGVGVRILTVGRLTAEKNHQLLIDAFARLPESLGARLMIVGRGRLEDALREQAAACRVEHRVVFPGFAVDPWPYYASAGLFVLSSNYEGYPVALVEAMHAGLRVVSTDCGTGPREILDDGRFGRLVPVADVEALARAIAESLDAPPRPAAVQERARLLEEASLRQYSDLLLGKG